MTTRAGSERWLTLVGSALAAACTGATVPRPAGEVVAVIGGEKPSIAVVDAAAGSVAARPGPMQPFKDAAALAPDTQTLRVVAVGRGGRELVAIDARTLRISSRLALNSPVASHQLDSLYIGGTALAFSPDGTRLFVGNAYRVNPSANPPPDGEAVAVLDANATHVLGTVGPIQVVEGAGLAQLPPGAARAAGGVLAIGTRLRSASGQPTQSQLFVIDPGTLAVVDSAVFRPPGAGATSAPDTLTQVVPAPDGRSVYVVGRSGLLYHYDLVARTVLATTPIPNGAVAVAPDGQTLYVTDAGDFFNTPGSGLVEVFGPNLEPRPPIDLRTVAAAANGQAPSTTGAAVSLDGSRLYVATGTASIGPLFPVQPLRLLIIDRASGALLRAVPVDDFGGATLIVVR
jgi:DNA-binding beta-propeller fold protein YncE